MKLSTQFRLDWRFGGNDNMNNRKIFSFTSGEIYL